MKNEIWESFVENIGEETLKYSLSNLSEMGKVVLMECLVNYSKNKNFNLFNFLWKVIKEGELDINESIGDILVEAIRSDSFDLDTTLDIIKNEWLHKRNKKVNKSEEVESRGYVWNPKYYGNEDYKFTRHLDAFLDRISRLTIGEKELIAFGILNFPIKEYRYVDSVSYMHKLFVCNEDYPMIPKGELKKEIFECINEKWSYIKNKENYNSKGINYESTYNGIKASVDQVLGDIIDTYMEEISEYIMEDKSFFEGMQTPRNVARLSKDNKVLKFLIDNFFRDESVRLSIAGNEELSLDNINLVIKKSTCSDTLIELLSHPNIREEEIVKMFKKAKNYKNKSLVRMIKERAPESCKALFSL